MKEGDSMNVTYKIFRLYYKGWPVGYMRFSDPTHSKSNYLERKVIQYAKNPDGRWAGSPTDQITYDEVELLTKG